MKDFHKLIYGQFAYGGKKYAHSGQKESTDVLFDRHTFKWLIGTLDKYTFRYKNTHREKDPLKIACYAFIIWLKRGFHLDKEGSQEVINTTVDIKAKYFDEFILRTTNFYAKEQTYFDDMKSEFAVEYLSEIFANISSLEWIDIKEFQLLTIYSICYIIWKKDFYDTGLSGEDTDTDNEEERIKKLESVFRPMIDKFLEVDEEIIPYPVGSQICYDDVNKLINKLASAVVLKGKSNGNKN